MTSTDSARPLTLSDRGPASWLALGTRVLGVLLVVAAADVGLGSLLAALHARSFRGQTHGGLVNAAVSARPEVLILGSSRARLAYDDARLSERLDVTTYNAACGGRGLLYARGVRALVTERAGPPRLVVLDACWFEAERDRANFLAPFWGASPIVDDVLAGDDPRARLKLASRSYRFQGRVPSLLLSLGKAPEPHGFAPSDRVMEPRPLRADVQQALVTLPDGYEEQLDRLVLEARDAGSGIVFTEAPSWGYRVPPPVRAAWDRVAARHGVPVIRLLPQEVAALREPGLFADPGHLNRRGALLATDLLAPELRALLHR